jgi:hypothetical protein
VLLFNFNKLIFFDYLQFAFIILILVSLIFQSMRATLKFLNYESMIKMEIKDEYFNQIQIPSLSLGFMRSEFMPEK